MTKVVYNACYGGFGLSHDAILRYATLVNLPIVYNQGVYTCNGEYFSKRDIPRTDPHLIQVIEEMGRDVSSSFAELTIRELPTGTKYCIIEDDGKETVKTIDEFEWSVA